MRIPRNIGSIFQVVAAALLTFNAIGCKHTQPTINYIGPSLNPVAVLQVGQVLQWESSDHKSQFSINFMYGFSPCKDMVISSEPVSGIETATCTVVAVPPSGTNFYYYIQTTPRPGNPFIQSARPCTGCVYGGDPVNDGPTLLHPHAAAASAPVAVHANSGNPIAIACETNGGNHITIDPQSTHPPSDGPPVLTWGPAPSARDWTLEFDAGNDPCPGGPLSGRNNSCDFTGATHYPYSYTVRVPSCGAALTATGQITAP